MERVLPLCHFLMIVRFVAAGSENQAIATFVSFAPLRFLY